MVLLLLMVQMLLQVLLSYIVVGGGARAVGASLGGLWTCGGGGARAIGAGGALGVALVVLFDGGAVGVVGV